MYVSLPYLNHLATNNKQWSSVSMPCAAHLMSLCRSRCAKAAPLALKSEELIHSEMCLKCGIDTHTLNVAQQLWGHLLRTVHRTLWLVYSVNHTIWQHSCVHHSDWCYWTYLTPHIELIITTSRVLWSLIFLEIENLESRLSNLMTRKANSNSCLTPQYILCYPTVSGQCTNLEDRKAWSKIVAHLDNWCLSEECL